MTGAPASLLTIFGATGDLAQRIEGAEVLAAPV